MTRVLDFWFGVWDPDLRSEYRRIYAESPRFARLPPTNDGHEETYCLRVSVCNRPTDEHEDSRDMKKGLTGLVQLGEFKGISQIPRNQQRDILTSIGAAMCIRKMGIALDGYKHGAVLLFRGTEMRHYLSHWTGKYRYAFDHTTHQSVVDAIQYFKENGRWGPVQPPKPPKKPRKGKKGNDPEDGGDDESDGDDDDGNPDAHGAGSSRNPPDPPQKDKKWKRKRADDDEEPDVDPPKKRVSPRSNKGGAAKKAKVETEQEDQSEPHSTDTVLDVRIGARPRGRPPKADRKGKDPVDKIAVSRQKEATQGERRRGKK